MQRTAICPMFQHGPSRPRPFKHGRLEDELCLVISRTAETTQ